MLPDYWRQTIALGPDPDGEGELVATLVRRGEAKDAKHAVLALHGYTDYFFNAELGDHFAVRGFAFYALDLHKCGRSRLPGQTPHFTTNLASYDAELDRALKVIAADTDDARVCLYGHSAGGLIVTLWLDGLRRRGQTAARNVAALVLNSPFFDLHGPAILRTPPTAAALVALARVRKMQIIRKPTPGGYGSSLHRDYSGEFEYNLDWKPLGGFPVTFGWINAIRRGQARLHRGLDVGVPNLILRSDHSVKEAPDPELIQRGDAVLDVAQIARWSGCVGNHTTVAPITDAKHDVFLSLSAPRAAAYRELDGWLDRHLGTESHETEPQNGTLPSTTRSEQG
ncbi:MAG: alpha/beta hydrolase [Mycobacterium sp.]|nr:alpha/beta hydrolase [Mycobacterium sp.]